MPVPFTEEELFNAYRVSHGESQARTMARQTIEGDRANSEALEQAFARGHVNGTAALAGMVLSPDLLIILSLQSDAMNRRVMSYLGTAMDNARFRVFWDARRAELVEELRG